MKSLLIGNGFNIQFGGMAYTSDFIIKRIKFNALLDKYNNLFDNKIRGDEIVSILENFVNVTNDVLNGKYDDYVKDDADLLYSINEFKQRYEKIQKFNQLMLEDWFLVLHLYLKYEDIQYDGTKEELYATVVQGFKQLFLDGIYNDGKIQEVYINVPKKVKKFLNKFDNIFTLNYDNNLEKLTDKKVYHLHGDFSVLHNSENPDNVLGYIRINNKENTKIDGMEHCYCNALLDYSGYNKFKQANENHNCILNSETFKVKYKYDKEFKSDLLKLKDNNKHMYEMIMTKINHPELKMATEYYFHEFMNIEDELYIIGLSPKNDSHIFDCINKNEKLKKVYFYYYSESEGKIVEDIFENGLYQAECVNKLWQSLNCSKKKYSVNYNIPDKIDEFIKIFNELSYDEVSKEQVLNEVKGIPEFRARKLCELLKKEIENMDKEWTSGTKEELDKKNSTISKIALSNGILPSSLFMLYVNYYHEIK